MKRSKQIKLVFAAAGALSLSACDQDPLAKSEFFADETACQAKNDPDACRQALADARAEHLRTAPRFASREECEQSFGVGNCGTPVEAAQAVPGAASAPSDQQAAQPDQQVAQAGGGGFFMPMMMGYMMGRMAGGGFTSQPLYRDYNNTAYSGSRTVGRINDRVSPPPRSPAGAATVQRGGFGQQGAYRGVVS